MNGQLQPVSQREVGEAYAWYCHGMKAQLSLAAHWDELKQRLQFMDCYRDRTLFWYLENGRQRGLLCMELIGSVWQLYLLVVVSPRRGYGRRAMECLQAMCGQHESIELDCLRRDRPVHAFYAEMGYRVIASGPQFLRLRWQLADQPAAANGGSAYNAGLNSLAE